MPVLDRRAETINLEIGQQHRSSFCCLAVQEGEPFLGLFYEHFGTRAATATYGAVVMGHVSYWAMHHRRELPHYVPVPNGEPALMSDGDSLAIL